MARLQTGKRLRDQERGGGENLNQLRDQLVALHEQWKKTSSERFIVILDEIDKWFPDRRDAANEAALVDYVKLFRILRAVAQERGSGMLSILVAAYRPDVNRQNLLREATGENPMYLLYQEKFVGYFGEDETRKMIREIGQWKEIEWTDEALEVVWRECGGHPMLSRFLTSEACEQGSRKEVGAEDVARVAAEVRGNWRKHRIGVYFEESAWKTLREEERVALIGCVRGGTARLEEWDEAMVSLEHFGLIELVSGGGALVNGGLLRDWLLARTERAS
ncbi:MAG: hypothetical protein FJW31_21175 [Acidobacteria bacterium]|nr:hypothetical protein [Acidobacteriota bacterium]